LAGILSELEISDSLARRADGVGGEARVHDFGNRLYYTTSDTRLHVLLAVTLLEFAEPSGNLTLFKHWSVLGLMSVALEMVADFSWGRLECFTFL